MRNQITNNTGIGLTLNALPGSLFISPSLTATVNDNNISSNTSHGVDIEGNGAAVMNVAMDNNTILTNGGRGMNILNDGGGNMTVALTRELVQGNTSDGIMVVQAEHYGNGAGPQMLFTMLNNNQVIGNGNGSSTGGLVMLVGTSDSGKVNADIENSTFTSNFGSDVYFQSFSSIGQVVANPLNPPLSRLDLQFRNNVVGVLNANPDPGTVVAPPPAFASQLANANNVNLERLPIPTPGTGPSTFRVENDATSSNTILNPGAGSSFTSSVLENYAATPYIWNLVPVGSLFP